MLDGRCPKCGATEVHRRYKGVGFVDRRSDTGGPWVFVGPSDDDACGTSPDGWGYVCVACGYWEYYISDRDLLLKVARDWERVPVSPAEGSCRAGDGASSDPG
jgi:hypothetical protein